jgi:MFS family permease
MRTRFTLFFGIFSVMALSNAIVPVLPAFAGSSTLQGAIYSAYFFGAFASTLPAGLLSDRIGRVPLIRAGLVITLVTGLVLYLVTSPGAVIALRFIEGVGAGCFVAAAMSSVNSGPGHRKMSGFFMALMNAGLVTGLVAAGWLATEQANPAAGILLFTLCVLIPACLSFFIRESPRILSESGADVIRICIQDYRWVWYSAVILIGITGVVTSLYPKFSGASPDIVGIWIAGMSCATIAAVLVASGITIPPYQVIRISAVLMAAGVLITIVSPWGFVILGGLAGFVMIAQMAVLARAQDHQGVVMGLYSTAGYLGMTALPVVAGLLADMTGFLSAFLLTALLAATVAGAIGRDPSARVDPGEE